MTPRITCWWFVGPRYWSRSCAPILAPAFVVPAFVGNGASREDRLRGSAVASESLVSPTRRCRPSRFGPRATARAPASIVGRAARARAVVRRRPDLDGTPLILEELDRRGLKAIFFVTGWRMLGHRPEDVARRDLVRKMAAHGHLIANHTMTHHDLCQNPEKQAAEIDGNTELIAQTTGIRPLLFRSPYGPTARASRRRSRSVSSPTSGGISIRKIGKATTRRLSSPT